MCLITKQHMLLGQVVGPLIEPKPKLLTYRNVVPDPRLWQNVETDHIIMSERDNQSNNYELFGNQSKLVFRNESPDP